MAQILLYNRHIRRGLMNHRSEKESKMKYDKAKQDVLQAAKSIDELKPEQQEQLAKDLFGASTVLTMYHLMRQYFG